MTQMFIFWVNYSLKL